MALSIDEKNLIINKAAEWISTNQTSQSELSKRAKVNIAYLSNMMRNQYSLEQGDQEVPISDKWFHHICQAIGFSIKKQYWKAIPTIEFTAMLHHLTVAKNDSRVLTIINETGLGKTFSVDRFCMQNPMHTYKVTVSKMHRVPHILAELCEMLGIAVRHNPVDNLMQVTKRLKELKMQGYKPLVIIDESENLSLPAIQMLKAMYDRIIEYASIVMIGTNQLITKLEKLKRKDQDGVPQFYRRIKAGIRHIPMARDYKPFFAAFNVEDKGLQKLLSQQCSNYGELHDYLEPFIKECDEQGMPMNEESFRLMFNLPKF